MMETKTAREIIEECDYSGGIDWNKMMPPEHELNHKKWIALNDLVQWLESLGDNRIAVKMLETLKEDKEGK